LTNEGGIFAALVVLVVKMLLRPAVVVVAMLTLLGASSSPAAGPQPVKNGQIIFSAYAGNAPQFVTADLRSQKTVPVSGLERAEDPTLSPDRRFVAFYQWVGDYPSSEPQIGVQPVGGGRPRWIATGCDPAWSPSSARVAFIHVTSPQERCTRAELAVLNRDGSGQRSIYSGIVWSPSWSPNGRWIAFLKYIEEPASRADLYVIRPDGSDPHSVAEGVGDGYSWSPDSARLAVITRQDNFKGKLAIGSVEGGPLEPLADDPYEPRWSPDGRRIAFTRSSSPSIFVVDVGNHRETVVGDGSSPAWVGGNRLAFVTTAGISVARWDGSERRVAIRAPFGVWYHDLWSLPRGGGVAFRRETEDYGGNLYTFSGKTHRLTAPGIRAVDPAASPNGRRVAFTRVRPEGNHVIGVVGSDGRGVRTLTHNRYGWDYQPSWSPDGKRVLFVRAHSYSDGSLYVVGARGGKPHLLWTGVRPGHPAWAPDGHMIAMDGVSGRSSTTRGIRLITPGEDGFVETTHPSEWSWDLAPSWSPDGTKLVFVRHTYSRWFYERVYVLTLATGQEQEIRGLSLGGWSHPMAARWAPDGTRLATVVCLVPGFGYCDQIGVGTMRPDGSDAVTLWQSKKLDALDVSWAASPRR
jgi:Tol biopolymer transport system component